MLKNRRGATGTEYGLLVGLIGVVLLLTIENVGQSINCAFLKIGASLRNETAQCPTDQAQTTTPEAPATPPENTPPTALTLADLSVYRNQSNSYTIPSGTFTDSDAGDTLTYAVTTTAGTALPSWFTVTNNNSTTLPTIAATPATSQTTTYSLLITATDSSGAKASTTLRLVPQNRAPTTTATLADQLLVSNAPWSFTLPTGTFTDADGDTITYAVTLQTGDALPSWLTQTTTNNLPKVSGTAPSNTSTSMTLLYTATDSVGATSSLTQALNIQKSVSSCSAFSANFGESVSATIDPDGESGTASAGFGTVCSRITNGGDLWMLVGSFGPQIHSGTSIIVDSTQSSTLSLSTNTYLSDTDWQAVFASGITHIRFQFTASGVSQPYYVDITKNQLPSSPTAADIGQNIKTTLTPSLVPGSYHKVWAWYDVGKDGLNQNYSWVGIYSNRAFGIPNWYTGYTTRFAYYVQDDPVDTRVMSSTYAQYSYMDGTPSQIRIYVR